MSRIRLADPLRVGRWIAPCAERKRHAGKRIVAAEIRCYSQVQAWVRIFPERTGFGRCDHTGDADTLAE